MINNNLQSKSILTGPKSVLAKTYIQYGMKNERAILLDEKYENPVVIGMGCVCKRKEKLATTVVKFKLRSLFLRFPLSCLV